MLFAVSFRAKTHTHMHTNRTHTHAHSHTHTARGEDREQLESEIRLADVICVVYSVAESDSSLGRIADFWLPYVSLSHSGANVPLSGSAS